MQKVAEECRDERRLNLIDSVIQDTRYAFRQFRRSPLFTLVAVLSLGLGIGANTALFTVFDALYLKKVPVHQPDDLVSFRWRAFGRPDPQNSPRVYGSLWTTSDEDIGLEYTSSTSFTLQMFREFTEDSRLPAEVFAFTPFEASADIQGVPHDVSGQLISGNYFRVLGASTIAGRPLAPADDDPSAEPAAVISYFVWQNLFGGDRSAIGQRITLNGLPVTIVGVTPPGFYLSPGTFPGFSLPMAFAPRVSQGRLAGEELWWLRLMARKRPEVTIEQVEGSLQGLFQASVISEGRVSPSVLKEQLPRLEVLSGSHGFIDISTPDGPSLLLLTMSAVFGLLLLIVCLNLANLLTARAAARQYEVAMRLTLGSGRGRLIRQLLTESLLLAMAGGAAGLLLAAWGKEMLKAYFGEQIPLSIDFRVLAFNASVAIATGILFGLTPALRATRSSLNDVTKRNLRSATAPRIRLNRSLVVIQVAMSVVLLIGAGLLTRTVGNWERLDVGFQMDNLFVFEVPPVNENTGSDFYDRLTERLAGTPSVTGVTTARCFPPSLCGNEVRAVGADEESRAVQTRRFAVAANFFETLGASIRAGRNFDRGDVPNAPQVAVIDEALASRLFPNSNPIGRLIRAGRNPYVRDFEIVGVVEEIVLDFGRSEVRPNYFTPVSQSPDPDGGSFIVRIPGDPHVAARSIRQAVADLDPRLPLFGMTTLKQLMDQYLRRPRLLSATWTLFSGIALFLTAIGLFGLMSYTVSLRVNEIGIRMALGATHLQVLALLMRQTQWLVVIGLIAGFAVSLGINQILWSFIFGVRIFDLWNFAWVAATVGAVTGLASYIPARRAVRVDPMTALRCE
jgi:predicted permease